jgi:coenzyme PQQ precursor peptide PqqA
MSGFSFRQGQVQITRLSPTFPRYFNALSHQRHLLRRRISRSLAPVLPHLGQSIRHCITPVARYIQLNAHHEFLNATVMPYSSPPHGASHVSLPDPMCRWQIFCINKETTMKTWFKPEITETEAGMEVTSYLPAELDRA